jgi:germination protein M
MAKNKRTSLGFLFWVAFALFIIVVFLANKNDISKVIEKTELVQVIKNKFTPAKEVQIIPSETAQPAVEDLPKYPKDFNLIVEDENNFIEPVSENSPSIIEEEKLLPPEDDKTNLFDTKQNIRKSNLYYIIVTDDGNITPKSVNRQIYYSDSPLTETLNALVKGPSPEEMNMGLLSLIPSNSRLLSVDVKENVAYLNFNEAFRFNQLGMEGYRVQLHQVVFSATEFSTIDKVQILIEGEKRSFLGPEGPFIGEPLSRSNIVQL